jgi:hypothetical protein
MTNARGVLAPGVVVFLINFRRVTLAVVASLVALLVFLPVSVVAIKAAIAQQSTNTNSEEIEDHSKEESRAVREERLRPSIDPPARNTNVVVAQLAAIKVVASVAPAPHPAQLSVRRML